MFSHRLIRKLTSIFVTAFICLNAGGAMCVAYCQTFDPAAETEHCPLKKKSEHCDPPDKRHPDFAALGSHELDCCPMTVSFFAAPFEKNSFSFDAAGEIASAIVEPVPPRFLKLKNFGQTFNYRGPPLDRRTNRLKNCIIRI